VAISNKRFLGPRRRSTANGISVGSAVFGMHTGMTPKQTPTACSAALRQIRSVRRSLTRTTLLTLVHALVVTKVDYCSSVLSGISGQLLQRLQSVFNAAARLVFSATKSEHITPLLRELTDCNF